MESLHRIFGGEPKMVSLTEERRNFWNCYSIADIQIIRHFVDYIS
jgi:hypothetical protein